MNPVQMRRSRDTSQRGRLILRSRNQQDLLAVRLVEGALVGMV